MNDMSETIKSPESAVDVSSTRLFCLSVRQPWAWLILHAGKNIENRNWPTRFRGRVLLHASKGMTRLEYAEAFDLLDQLETTGRLAIPTFEKLRRGGIVGEMEIVDCVTQSDSPWFFGPYGFELRNQKPLPFQPMKGALGFFRPDDRQNGESSHERSAK